MEKTDKGPKEIFSPEVQRELLVLEEQEVRTYVRAHRLQVYGVAMVAGSDVRPDPVAQTRKSTTGSLGTF